MGFGIGWPYGCPFRICWCNWFQSHTESLQRRKRNNALDVASFIRRKQTIKRVEHNLQRLGYAPPVKPSRKARRWTSLRRFAFARTFSVCGSNTPVPPLPWTIWTGTIWTGTIWTGTICCCWGTICTTWTFPAGIIVADIILLKEADNWEHYFMDYWLDQVTINEIHGMRFFFPQSLIFYGLNCNNFCAMSEQSNVKWYFKCHHHNISSCSTF